MCLATGTCPDCEGKSRRMRAVAAGSTRIRATEPRRRSARGTTATPPSTLEHASADVRFSSWAVFQLAYKASISRGSLEFHTPRPTRVGQAIRVTLHLPDGRELSLNTSIAHVRSMPGANQVGVHIPDTTADQLYRDMLAAMKDG